MRSKTTIEIGEKLFISPRTVEGHRNNLLQNRIKILQD
jgi:DNA-binding CsgD family transcriptional regulator